PAPGCSGATLAAAGVPCVADRPDSRLHSGDWLRRRRVHRGAGAAVGRTRRRSRVVGSALAGIRRGTASGTTPRRRAVSWRSTKEGFGDKVVHALGRAAADSEDPGVAVVTLDFGVAHVAHAAVQLDCLVDDELASLDSLVLRHRGLGEQTLLT